MTFFVLAYSFAWILISLVSVSQILPVLGLFAPALTAVSVIALTEAP